MSITDCKSKQMMLCPVYGLWQRCLVPVPSSIINFVALACGLTAVANRKPGIIV